MKTLEDQLAEYGRQRSEAQVPLTSDELKARHAPHDLMVSHDIRTESERSPESLRVAPASSRGALKRLAGWQIGVACAVITLLGFGLTSVFTGSTEPSRTVGILASSSNTEAVGKRSVNVGGVSLTVEVPAGWKSTGDFLISKDVRGDQAPEAVIYFATFPGGSEAVPCPDLPFGQLPENADIDLAARSLSSRFGDYTVGGLRGRFVQVELGDRPSSPPRGAVYAPSEGCNPGYLYSWTPQSGGGNWTESKAGDMVDAWFIDVDESMLVVVAEDRGLMLTEVHEIFQIVDSIRFPSIVPSPTADYVIDMNTGVTTLLPLAIRSQNPSQYAVSPDGSRVAYAAPDSDGSFQLFTAGIDGTDIRQITHPPTEANSPAWSPDGSLVAYVQSQSIFILDVATGESRQIPNVDADFGVQFTPDGSSILYTSMGSDDDGLWTVPIGGGNSTQLIGRSLGVEAGGGSLSPDGSLVTFCGNRIGGPGAERFLARTDGSKPQGLRDSKACGGVNPGGTWSPDGTRIVIADENDVYVLDVVTGEASVVAEGKGAQWLDDHTLLVEAWGQ
ncbi:MAG: hypothetical protein WAN34_05000 [Acidimicrobiia bacterium]